MQDRVNGSNARFKIIRAARRIGKSFMAAKDVLPDILMPNTRGWIVGPSYELAEKEFRYILDFLNQCHKKLGLPKPEVARSNYKAGDLYIKTPWGSEVIGKSADRPLALVGEENDWILLSEAAQHSGDTWFRYLRPTLSTRLGRALFPTTPDIAGQWLYKLENESRAWPEWETFTCPAWECPHYDKREIETARLELSDAAFREQYGGEWTFYEGRVFKPYDETIHVIEPFKIPNGWRWRAGVDYGGTRDATAVEWFVESPDHDIYFVDEYYAADRPTELHTEIVRSKELGRPTPVRISDHHALGVQLARDWAKFGVPSVNCPVDRKTRRDRFLAMLELRENRRPYHVAEASLPAGNYPRLFIFRGKCPNLEREIQYLAWKDTTRKEGTYGDTVGDDHAIDAAEYGVFYATKGRVMTPVHTRRVPNAPRIISTMTGY
jgi:hypothetical protein